MGNYICELNYMGTKSKIENKLGDQKYNFNFCLSTRYGTIYNEWIAHQVNKFELLISQSRIER